ncbi:MAG: hypothetical protein FWH25_05140 [Syntrophorhabdaceae bacterium]|nr:hypothetical protein [Syntrophorhabdaceae bacterium]
MAKLNLGVMYVTGQGAARNYTEAVKWYRLAAEQGDAMAQCNLWFMYEKVRLAAEQGDADAKKALEGLPHN